MQTLLEAKALTKRYGSTVALDDVSFQVGRGITGLLGPHGAGKSTAMKLALGILQPTDGSVEVMGREPYSAAETRTWLGYMPEHDCLPGAVPAAEFLTHMAQVSGIPPAFARTRAADVMRHVGLHEERYRSIRDYSTGMKQRVKLAQALVHDPHLLFLDEPTNGLDPEGRDEMLELIERTGNEFGISIVMSSHLLGEIERVCETLIVIEEGKLLQAGRISELTDITSVLLVEVDECADELAHRLTEQGLPATADGRQVALEIDPQRVAVAQDLVVQGVVDLSLSLLRLEQRRRQLEELFAAAAPPGGTRHEP